MVAKQPAHIRLPLRADTVEGREEVPGQPPKTSPVNDPRTVTQDPTPKELKK